MNLFRSYNFVITVMKAAFVIFKDKGFEISLWVRISNHRDIKVYR